ncbi:MAG: hypothetical protein H0V24_03135 [Chloroflexia bacterium]|nr:hypothetical protein [Chloroflexia bacterium]
MIVVGLLGAIVAVGLRLDPFLALGGVMLAVSGLVKIVMLRLWRELGPPERASPTGPRRNR